MGNGRRSLQGVRWVDFEEGVGGGQCTGPSLGVDLQGGQQGGHRRSNARSERGGEQDFDEEDEGDGRMRGGDIDVADIVDGRGGDEPQGDMHDQGSKRGREGGYASLPHRRPRGDAGEGESASEDGGALEEGWQALRSRGEAAAVTMCVWVIYWMTMPRAITGGDSGEVMAAACSWAPAHPPGYPLFVALSQGAMWAFRGLGGSPAYRVNLMCSLFSAGAVYNLHRAVKVLTGDGSAALVAAGMYGLSPLIWNNAIQAEVFSLNNLFVCLVTNVAVQYLSRNRTYGKQAHHLAYVGAFSSGLGLTNQHTLVFYLAIIVPAVLWSGRDALLRPLPFLSLALLFFVGLVPYSLTWINRGCPLPWDEHEGAILGTKLCPGAEQVPRYTWGDSRSFRGFMNHLLRRDYGTLSLAAGGASAHGKPVSLLTGLAFYLEDTAGPRLDERVRGGSIVSHDGQLLYFGVPFALLGAYLCMASPSRERHAAAKRTLLVAYVIYLVVFHYLANLPIRVALFRAVHARFWQMPNSTLFVFLGLGFSRSMRGLPASFRWLLGLLGVCLQCVHNYAQQDQSRNVAVEMLARTALESAPQNAIIICSGDLQLNPALYLSVCEGVRPDVSVLSLQLMSYRWYAHNKTERYPAVIFPGKSHWPDEDGYSLQGFFQANIDARPIMIYGGNRPAETLERLLEDASLNEEQFYHVPYGLLDRIVRTETQRPNIRWMARDFAVAIAPMELWAGGWGGVGHLPDLMLFGEDTWEEQVAREYYLALHRFGHAAMEHYRTLPGDDCAGECPEGCDCERTMSTTLESARHVYTTLNQAAMRYAERGLVAPFNWDGAVDLALGDIYEEDRNAALALVHWCRYLDVKKEGDIVRNVVSRKVTALRQQAIGITGYEFPVVA